MNKIAIVGHGFVGKAIEYGFVNTPKFIVDPIHGNTIDDLREGDFDLIFVAVPTPMGKDGAIDGSIVEETVNWLKDNATGLIVIKSTVTPDIIEKLQKDSINVIYNPEFLTEKNANEDFVNPPMHIFGGNKEQTLQLEELYNKLSNCKPCPSFHMTGVEASFVKYGINCFLASKVLWFNQFYDVVNGSNADFSTIISAIGSDMRINSSHTLVPGFDNKRGFGGACFPKDTAAFAAFASQTSEFPILENIIEANNNYRRNYLKNDRELEQNVNYN